MKAEIAIIGAGIAGASLAAELAPHVSVILIEGETQPGYHSTGRSAAFWSETYGGPLVQPLTSRSGAFLAAPPPDFSDAAFVRPRTALHLADAGGRAALDAFLGAFADSEVRLEPLGREALLAILPGLRPGWDEGALERSCSDIDVAALHAAYLRAARRHGTSLVTDTRVNRIQRSGGRWLIEARGGTVDAAVLVNAAGAWADHIAEMAGILRLGIQPYRRTVAQVRVDPAAPDDLPLVIDVLGRFYFKPEAGGRLWLSPHDETPCAASDCAPEELDVALAVDRFERVVDWRVEAIERKWAGLRSFAPDRLPVYGFAPECPSFFWCAGQGGFGIQTAPAAAKLAAALLLGRSPAPMIAGLDPAPYRAGRFAK